MATSSGPIAVCAMNASTMRTSTAWLTQDGSWCCGATVTIMSGRNHRFVTKNSPKRLQRLSNLRAPRRARLPNTKTTTFHPKDSRYKRMVTGGGQVTMRDRLALLQCNADMVDPPKKDEAQNHTCGHPRDTGFGRDALVNQRRSNDRTCASFLHQHCDRSGLGAVDG